MVTKVIEDLVGEGKQYDLAVVDRPHDHDEILLPDHKEA